MNALQEIFKILLEYQPEYVEPELHFFGRLKYFPTNFKVKKISMLTARKKHLSPELFYQSQYYIPGI